ncbi:MAG: hypothetical protein JW910_22435, partial [Anaerolineae bacterium]|nr:hypothetical protein [Anaerolineae bacterium]
MKGIRLLVLMALVVTTVGLSSLTPATAAPTEHPVMRTNTTASLPTTDRAAAQARLADWAASMAAQAAGEPITSSQAQQQAAWTVMVYIAADNDLEEFAISDLNELELMGSTTDVNVVVQLDRATGYDSSNGNWTDTRRIFITRDEDYNRIESEVVQNLGETNTGDPDTLADFATWAMQTYPATRYALVIWDHGGSWLGIATDASADDDDLSMPEVGEALAAIVQANNGQPLDLIGFDACLMSQFEVYYTVAPYALYGVGAEENIPGYGWDYFTPIQALVQNPAGDGLALGRAIVDSFVEFYSEVVTYYDVFDLGVVDLTQAGDVLAALNDFEQAVAANPAAVLSAIADARNNTIAFGGFDDPQYFDIWSAADLIQFMDLLEELSPSAPVAQAAQVVATAGEQMAVYHLANAALQESRGMTIYFPRHRSAYTQYGLNTRYVSQMHPDLAIWQTFLDVFHGTATNTGTTGTGGGTGGQQQVGQALAIDILGAYPEVASIHEPSVLLMDISGRDIVDVVFAAALRLEDGTSIVIDYTRLVSRTTTEEGTEIVDWADGISTRNFAWDTEVPVISDGTVEVPAVLFQNRENPDSAVVDGLYIPRAGNPVDAQLVYNLDTYSVTSVWGVRDSSNGPMRFEIAWKPGDTFQPYWMFLDESGELQYELASDVLTFSSDPFTYRLLPAPTGDYDLSIVVEDAAGETVVDSIAVAVNNDGLDETERGFIDLEFGVSFRYPANWIEPRFIATDSGGRLFTGDPATGTLLTVLPYDQVSSGLDVAQQVIDSWNALDNAELTNQQEVAFGDNEAYVVDYAYTFNGQPRVGAVLAVYLPDAGIGYGFDLDAPENNLDAASTAFTLLVDSLEFFDVSSAIGTSNWAPVTAGNGLVSFVIPSTWVETTVGDWSIYSAPGDTVTFAALSIAPSQGLSNEQLADQYFGLLQQNTNVNNVDVYASEPYYIGNEEWYVVGFTYTNTNTGLLTAGAFFVSSIGAQEYVFWVEAPDAAFD